MFEFNFDINPLESPSYIRDLIDYDIEENLSITSREREINNLKEIKSNNNNFMQEKNIKYNLYPLYINWKEIEKEKENNVYYDIFKLFGYFGEAIFLLLKETFHMYDNYYNYKNFLKELYSFYTDNYDELTIVNDKFFKKIINIYDDVISLIKNKIIIFKEITVFLIIMRLYELYFIKTNANDKVLEVLKYQYIILSNIKDDEYNKIYKKYFKKLNYQFMTNWISKKMKIPKDKKSYINNLRSIYKKIIKMKKK